MNVPEIIRTQVGSKLYYVYTLSYPQGFVADSGADLSTVVFYVGKGTVRRIGVQRIDEHERDAGYNRPAIGRRKIDVIRLIWSKGMRVEKNIIFETDIEIEALRYEEQRIKQYGSWHLTNNHTRSYSPLNR